MIGGSGNNTYVVDNVNDQISEYENGGIDEVKANISYTLGANLENLTLTGSSDLSGIGNELNNEITGNSGNNIIDGGDGIDTMAGGFYNTKFHNKLVIDLSICLILIVVPAFKDVTLIKTQG